MIDAKSIEVFLNTVDKDFPIPISCKVNIHDYSLKLYEKANICCVKQDNTIISMVAGYIDNAYGNLGYIAIVGTLQEYRGHGLASKLLREFLNKARDNHLDGVHVYTHKNNCDAIMLYKKNGFVKLQQPEEPRENDVHMSCIF